MRTKHLVLFLILITPSVANSQFTVTSDGKINTHQNPIYFRNDANYLSGIGYGVFGASSTSLTFFADKYRYMEFRQADSNILLAKFYFSSTINSCYTDFYGDISANKAHWTGGLRTDILSFSGYDMATLLPNRSWYGALGTSTKWFGAGYIDHVYYDQLTNLSDLRVKENIADFEGGLDKITSLRPVTYDLKLSYFDSIPDEARQDVYETNKNSIGFIAQEVQQVIPDLVKIIPGTDYSGVNTIDLIPVLVKATQEQQEQLELLKKVISEQEADIILLKDYLGLNDQEPSKKNAIDSSSEPDAAIESNVPLLFQNIPNPFNEETKIQAFLPVNLNDARIVITDLNGSTIHSTIITDRGNISITIPGSQLTQGVYIYSLIIDGRTVDSKRMLLT
jgi:hypothetical protein